MIKEGWMNLHDMIDCFRSRSPPSVPDSSKTVSNLAFAQISNSNSKRVRKGFKQDSEIELEPTRKHTTSQRSHTNSLLLSVFTTNAERSVYTSYTFQLFALARKKLAPLLSCSQSLNNSGGGVANDKITLSRLLFSRPKQFAGNDRDTAFDGCRACSMYTHSTTRRKSASKLRCACGAGVQGWQLSDGG